jgi:hypothetical protein
VSMGIPSLLGGYTMPKVKYHVRLSDKERKTLLKMISKGSASAKCTPMYC